MSGNHRFYSREIIDHVHRARAIEEWSRLIRGDQVSLERGLGAFDMFVLHDERGDLAEVSSLCLSFPIYADETVCRYQSYSMI